MDLTQCREKIDELDRQLVALFAERMETAAQVAAYKKEHGLPVLDAARERQKLRAVGELAPEAFRDDTETLYRLMFELSRSYQHRLLDAPPARVEEIRKALDGTPQLSRRVRPLPVRAWRARIRSLPASVFSERRISSIFPILRPFLRLWTRDCAATAWCRWKTAPQAL